MTLVLTNGKRICALEGCDEAFVQAPQKRYCSERHQRTAEKRRYRERHVETAVCARTGCEEPFERTTKNGPHHQKFCSKRCQYLNRSVSYRQRLDIQAGIRRAREVRAWGTPRDDLEPDRVGGALRPDALRKLSSCGGR